MSNKNRQNSKFLNFAINGFFFKQSIKENFHTKFVVTGGFDMKPFKSPIFVIIMYYIIHLSKAIFDMRP